MFFASPFSWFYIYRFVLHKYLWAIYESPYPQMSSSSSLPRPFLDPSSNLPLSFLGPQCPKILPPRNICYPLRSRPGDPIFLSHLADAAVPLTMLRGRPQPYPGCRGIGAGLVGNPDLLHEYLYQVPFIGVFIRLSGKVTVGASAPLMGARES